MIEITNKNQFLIPVDMDREEVGRMFENYNLNSACVIDIIFASLGVLNTLDDVTVPMGLNSLSTIKISKNSSGKSLFSLK